MSPEEAAASAGVSRDFLDEHIAPELRERWLERAAALTIGAAGDTGYGNP